MWSWSTANSHNWTSCFLFSPLLAYFTVWPCFSVVCCTFSFVSGHTVFFFLSCFILYIVIRLLGRDFVQIKSYHIISYHIISYHIISYHIISYHIISYHIIIHVTHASQQHTTVNFIVTHWAIMLTIAYSFHGNTFRCFWQTIRIITLIGVRANNIFWQHKHSNNSTNRKIY